MVSSADKELEQQLLEAGSRLADPPPSVDELLPLFDQVGKCLAKVEQSPGESMQNALSPLLPALIADKLFKHPDVNVKVSVAYCISEITRITAPEAPYDDEQMKEVFQLIVSSLENLSNKSSQSYEKKISILETVAKVRSCVLMLDLECDELIIEMFQNFLKSIRDYHPESVFSSMEIIMSLCLEESEEITLELLSPILASIRNNEEVLPIARKLGEKVLGSSSIKLKPYLIQAVKTLGISFSDYSKVVATICEVTSRDDLKAANVAGDLKAADVAGDQKDADVAADQKDADVAADQKDADVAADQKDADVAADQKDGDVAAEQKDGDVAAEQKDGDVAGDQKDGDVAGDQKDGDVAGDQKNTDVGSDLKNADEADEHVANEETVTEAQSVEQNGPPNDTASKPVKENGILQKNEDKSLVDPDSSEKQGVSQEIDQPKAVDRLTDDGPGSLDVEKAVSLGNNREQASKRKGRKPNSWKLAEPSEISQATGEKEAEDFSDRKSLEISCESSRDPTVDQVLPLGSEKETADQLSLPKAVEGKTINVSSPPGGSMADESCSRKTAGSETNEGSVPTGAVLKKASEGVSDTENKLHRRSGKKLHTGSSKEAESPLKGDAPRKGSSMTNDSEAKPLELPAKKIDALGKTGEGLTPIQSGKKKRRTKAILEKGSTKDDDVSSRNSAEHLLKESPKSNSKRKRTPGKEKELGDVDSGELIGRKIKVWWPLDKKYYVGVVDSFDSVKNKHKVVYLDSDVEELYLKKEKWEIISDLSGSDGEEKSDHPNADASSETPLKKKLKANSDQSTKRGKLDISHKRIGSASSSKSKVAGTKSDHKSKDAAKADSKSQKHSRRSDDDDGVRKYKHDTPKSSSKSKKDDRATPEANKSKEDSSISLKASRSKYDSTKRSKSSIENIKGSFTGKGRTPNRGEKSNANGGGRKKSGSSKVKGGEDAKKDISTDTAKVVESSKAKSTSSSKVSGKRRRGT